MRCNGARPVLIISRSPACSGSSNRRNSPSSTLNPSSHIWRMRVTTGVDVCRPASGSGIVRLGASSPPRVVPAPRNLEEVAGAGWLLGSGPVFLQEKKLALI